MAKVATLSDTFPGTSLSALWVADRTYIGNAFDSSASVSVSGGAAVLASTNNSAFDNDARIVSTSIYDLTNSQIVVRWSHLFSASTEGTLLLYDSAQGSNDPTNRISIGHYAGDLYAVVTNAGTNVVNRTTPWNDTNHAWVRISHDGTNIIWETAPDVSGSPGTWTRPDGGATAWSSAASLISGWAATSVKVLIRYRQVAAASSNPSVSVLDVNPTTVVSHATSGAIAGPGAAVVGAAKRFRAFAATGAIAGPGAAVAGSAARVGAPPNHAVTGAITGPGAAVTGVAAVKRIHATTGALVGPGSAVTGAALLNQRLSNIKDDFSGAALDGTKFASTVVGTAGAAATATQSGGQLVLNPTSGNSTDGIEVRNLGFKTMVGDAIFTRLSQAPRTAANGQGVEARFAIEASAGNSIGWFPQSDGSIQAQRRVGGSVMDNLVLSYTPSTHAWLRLKEDSGQFYLQYAPASSEDPPLEAQWVTAYQIATANIGFAVTSVKMVLGCVIWWNQAGVPTQPAKFDCINSKTVAPLAHDATGAVVGPGAVVAGVAGKKVLHAATGAIPGQAAVVAGAVARRKEHYATGAVYGPGAIISANGSTSDVTRKRWIDKQDTAGAWSDPPQTAAGPWTLKDGASGGWGPK